MLVFSGSKFEAHNTDDSQARGVSLPKASYPQYLSASARREANGKARRQAEEANRTTRS